MAENHTKEYKERFMKAMADDFIQKTSFLKDLEFNSKDEEEVSYSDLKEKDAFLEI